VQIKKGKDKLTPPLGGTVLGGRGNLARDVPTLGNQWHDLPHCLEYRIVKEVLSQVFSHFFANFSLSFIGREEDDGKAMTGYARGC
jgi:hypothetical protein